jgi:hypothetical protein
MDLAMNHRGFFLVSVFTIGVIFFFGLLLQLFLIGFGEYPFLETIVKSQNKHSFIYNGLRFQFDEYKRAQFKYQKPKIVSIGSSRSFDIRGYFFNESYYGLGGSVDTPLRARIYTKRLFVDHKPQLLIYPIDFWGFCDKVPDYSQNIEIKKRELIEFYSKTTSLEESFSLLKPLIFGKLFSPRQLGNLVVQRARSDGIKYLGISGHLSQTGFGQDGSVYKFGEVIKDISPLLMNKPIEEHDGGAYRFNPDCHLNQNAVSDLVRFIKEMKIQGIKVVSFLAPLPRVVIQRLIERGKEYDYIWELRRTLSSRLNVNAEYYDFLDAESFGAPDCEFRDYLHGGEVTYLRIFNDIILKQKSILIDYVDHETVRHLISNFSGYRIIAADDVGKRYDQLLKQQKLCPVR